MSHVTEQEVQFLRGAVIDIDSQSGSHTIIFGSCSFFLFWYFLCFLIHHFSNFKSEQPGLGTLTFYRGPLFILLSFLLPTAC